MLRHLYNALTYRLTERPADGETVLEVTIDAAGVVLDEFEVVEEGRRFREWLIRAAVLNPLMIGIQVAEE